MTRVGKAKKGIVTPEMKTAARKEGLPYDTFRKAMADGSLLLYAIQKGTSSRSPSALAQG